MVLHPKLTIELISLLRQNLLDKPERVIEMGLTPPMIVVILSKAA